DFFVVPGILASGKIVDVYHLAATAPSFAKPRYVYADKFDNYRWRKYTGRLSDKRYKRYLPHYGGYLCRRYNSQFGDEDPLTDLIIYRMVEKTEPVGEPMRLDRRQIWRHWCSKKGPDIVTPALRAAGLLQD
ncbi:MAG: hypothetical protein O2949_13140, partial [Proteobacteria bacterium]|nr:hypothetical protein [Pseudomonadota bacterium]